MAQPNWLSTPDDEEEQPTTPSWATPSRRRPSWFNSEVSSVKPEDVAARIQNDPIWERLMTAQASLSQGLMHQEGAPNPDRQRRITMAGDAIEDHISELARKYDVGRDFITSLARTGATPTVAEESDGPTFGERNARFFRNELQSGANFVRNIMGAIPEPVRKVGGNALTAVGGLVEPFTLPADVTRDVAVNTGERLQGERPEFAEMEPGFNMRRELWEVGQVGRAVGETVREFTDRGQWITYVPDLRWGEKYMAFTNEEGATSPYETGVAASGRELLQQFNLEEPAVDFIMRWGEPVGITNREQAAEVAGVVAEMGTDPLLAADFAFVGSRALKLAGLGNTDFGKKSINLLERMGEDMLTATSPAGVTNTARKSLGVVNRAAFSVNRAIGNLLDTRVAPGAFPGVEVGMATQFGIDPAATGARVRDLIYGRGVSPFDDDSLRWLYGGNEVGPMSAYTGQLGAVDRARGAERAVQRRTAMGIKSVNDAIATRIGTPKTKTLHGQKVVIPQAYEFSENAMKMRSLLHQNVWDLMDNYGVPNVQQGLKEILPRVREGARLYGVDPDVATDAFKEASLAARATILDTGYLASRYDEFIGVMDEAAFGLGLDPARMRHLMEAQYAGVDVRAIRETGEIPEGRIRVRATREELERFPEFEDAVKTLMDVSGFDPKLSPLRYLKGIREGYMRRVIGAKLDPTAMYKSLGDYRNLMVVANAALPDVPGRLAGKFGDEAREALESYMAARPRHGMIATSDVADLIRRETGREVSFEEVADVIYQDDRNYTLLRETERLLREQGADIPTRGGAAQYGGTRALSGRQDFDEDELTSLLQVIDAPVAMAQMGQAVARNVRSDEMLKSAFDFLSENDLIIPPERIADSAFGNIGKGRNADSDRIWQFQTKQGTQYVTIPRNQTAWGPLAGQAIPYRVAREVVKTVSLPSHQRRHRLEQLLNNYRKTMLSPLPTTVVNILGNMNFIRYAGADMFDMLGNLPRAIAAREEFYRSGKVKGLEGAENMLSFFHEGTFAKSVGARAPGAGSEAAGLGGQRELVDALEELSRATSTRDLTQRTEGILDKLSNLTTRVTSDPKFGGFLGWFAWGEEVTRLAAAYAARDKLIRRGIPKEEAIARAAHLANNAAGDYGSMGLIPQFMKKWGLSMFPQFAWFNAGRTARVAAERPGSLLKPEYLRQGWNAAMVEGGEEEQERVTALMEQWQRFEQPFLLKLPGREPGEFAVGNLSRFNPLGLDTETLLTGPVMLDAYLPIMESLVANLTTPENEAGMPFYSKKYGEEVFTAGGNRAAGTAGFLARQYIYPGHQRMIRNTWETIRYYQTRDAQDAYNQVVGRYQNRDAAQLLARMLGFSTFKVGTQGETGQRSLRRRITELERTESPASPNLLENAFGLGDRGVNEQLQDYDEEMQEFMRYMDELMRHAP